jgi:arabinogalactan endo-1,4-beta-galactosidase
MNHYRQLWVIVVAVAVMAGSFVVRAFAQEKPGKPASVMMTCYSTTLMADGRDHAGIRIVVTDSAMREIPGTTDSIRIYVSGKGTVTTQRGQHLVIRTDTAGKKYYATRLENGILKLTLTAGTIADRVRVEARSGTLWPASHEIHTLPPGFVMMTPKPSQLPLTTLPIERMIGADISWLPQLEDRGIKFYENGKPVDAVQLLHEHGFNYIRLRIFVNPENENGYAPGKGYCGLEYTLGMARRIKEAGMKLLLDFHYSDYWADPQQQYKPQAWAILDFSTLKDSVKSYTTRVLLALKAQGTLPSMVQIGNEINHGILWPDGHISHPDQLAELLKAGVEGVRAVDPDLPVMMHLALGGQNQEAVFWLDNMLARGVKFDIIGLSYYPRWHGTLEDLKNNLEDLARRYNKPLDVVEYSDFKKEVNDIIFGLPDGKGKGSCIWEPLNWRSGLFDRNGNVTPLMNLYDELSKTYLK